MADTDGMMAQTITDIAAEGQNILPGSQVVVVCHTRF